MATTPATTPATIDEYITGCPAEHRERLQLVRATITRAVPEPEERIRYGMPAIMLGERYALHFAAWKKHLGLYPIAHATGIDDALEAEIEPHRTGVDSVVFPWNEPIDYDLIERMTAFVVRLRASAKS
jgi:uncharacterized protein YdhG (YjbR/CyaY superfamily)